MRKEYDFTKLKKRDNVSTSVSNPKVPVHLRIDSNTLLSLRTESTRMGIPYQTLIGSILYRYINGEIIDKTTFINKKNA